MKPIRCQKSATAAVLVSKRLFQGLSKGGLGKRHRITESAYWGNRLSWRALCAGDDGQRRLHIGSLGRKARDKPRHVCLGRPIIELHSRLSQS